jgi:hypothetical protein
VSQDSQITGKKQGLKFSIGHPRHPWGDLEQSFDTLHAYDLKNECEQRYSSITPDDPQKLDEMLRQPFQPLQNGSLQQSDLQSRNTYQMLQSQIDKLEESARTIEPMAARSNAAAIAPAGFSKRLGVSACAASRDSTSARKAGSPAQSASRRPARRAESSSSAALKIVLTCCHRSGLMFLHREIFMNEKPKIFCAQKSSALGKIFPKEYQ